MRQIFLLSVVLVVFLAGEALARDLAIVANVEFPVSEMTRDQVKEIYRGERLKIGPVRIFPFDQRDPEIRGPFLKEVLGTSPHRYNRYWIKRVFQEGGAPPKVLGSSREVLSRIQDLVGGIGYVWASEAQGVPGVKVLLILPIKEED